MSEHQFTLRPRLLHALAPKFFRRVLLYAAAAIPIYFLMMMVSDAGVIALSSWKLIVALVVLVIALSSVHIKFEAVALHATRYLFYDTHVVLRRKILRAKRQSVPYRQISKITNDHGIWDRMTSTADIILHTQEGGRDVRLRSIHDPEGVEDRIYRLLKLKQD